MNRTRPPRVIVVDDDPLARAALVDRLHRIGATVLCHHGDAEAAVRSVQEHAPDLVLSTVWLRGTNGLRLTAAVKRVRPSLRVLLLSIDVPGELVEAARMAGADGIVRKADLVDSLSHVIFPASASQRSGEPGPIAPRPVALSEREKQIASSVIAGSTNAQIAEQLGLSRSTVQTYVSRIYDKFDVMNRVQLVRAVDALAFEAGAPGEA